MSELNDLITKHESIKATYDNHSSPSNGEMDKTSKATLIKSLLKRFIKELYKTPEGIGFGQITIDGHDEIIRIDSPRFKDWALMTYEMEYRNVPPGEALKMGIQSINSESRLYGLEKPIFLRVGEYNGNIYIDLCNKDWEVVEITKEGFRVLKESPILFRKSQDMGELPIPIYREGKYDYRLLYKHLNVSTPEQLDIITAWVLGSFLPNDPKPILNIQAEAGSGKSVNTRIIRSLVDPAKRKSLLSKEVNVKDTPIDAYNQFCLAYDNLSGISKAASDLLCCLSTGGAITTRELYTNSGEVIFDLKRAVILNGIDDLAKRQDLMSRSLIVNLPLLTGKRRTERDIFEGFEKDWPFIFGSLVHAISIGLKNENLNQSEYKRMQDFGEWVGNCSKGLGWEDGYWEEIYEANQIEGVEQAISTDPFAVGIMNLMDEGSEFTGTATILLTKIATFFPEEEMRYNRAFPKSNQIKARIKRISPLLREYGIEVSYRRSQGKSLIEIRKR